MNSKIDTKNFSGFVIAIMILIAALTRLFPHPFNFTAVGAIALFAGANFKNSKLAFIIPLAVLLISDIFLGFHQSMLPVYTCFAFTVFLGILIKNRQSVLSVVFSSLVSSAVFFLVTNLPIWYSDIKLYPVTLEGTLQSYEMAIPFFKNQVAGDLFYNAVLFLGYHYLSPVLFSKTKKAVQ
jgi:hypothetical protein